jgi:hypothetical protein
MPKVPVAIFQAHKLKHAKKVHSSIITKRSQQDRKKGPLTCREFMSKSTKEGSRRVEPFICSS